MLQNKFSNYAAFKKVLWIIFIAISSSLLIMAVLAIFLAPQIVKDGSIISKSMSEIFLIIDFAMLLLLIPGINFIYRKLLQKKLDMETLSQQLNGYLISKIIIWAIIESVGFVILIQYLLSDYSNLIFLFIGVMYLLMRHIPTDREIRNIFQISSVEIDKELKMER